MRKPLVQTEGTLRPMLALAAPVVVMNFLHIAVEYVDTWLAGNYLTPNEAPLAAINQIRYVMWMVFTLFTVVSIGATAVVARFVGARDYRSARRATGQSLLLGMGISMVVLAVGWLAIEPLVGLLNLEPTAATLAIRYLRIALPVLPAIMVEEVGSACLRAAGDTVSGMVAVGVVNVVNIILSASLLTGWGPFPRLGWQGLAIGSVCGRVVGATIILGLLIGGRAGLWVRWRLLRPDWAMQKRLLRIGLPGGVDSVSLVFCQLWFVAIINRLGNTAAAAHGIGVSIEALAYMPGAAFQLATATLVGQFLGAGDRRRAKRSALMACGVGTAIMSLCGVAFFVFAPQFAGIFLPGSGNEVGRTAATLLRVSAISMPPLAVTIVLTGALRGSGDTRWPLLFTLIGFLGIRIPLAYYLAYEWIELPLVGLGVGGCGLGVIGAWYAMITDIFVRCALVSARFLHGGWRGVRV